VDDARATCILDAAVPRPSVVSRDLIADYFQSVAPAGIYRYLPNDGRWASTLLVNKLHHGAGTTTTVTVLVFVVAGANSRIHHHVAAESKSVMKDDLSAIFPRAFVYPLFLAFLYYLCSDCLNRVCGDRSAGIVLSICIHCSYYLNSTGLGQGYPVVSESD